MKGVRVEDEIYGECLKFVYFFMKGCEPCDDFEPHLKELEAGVLKQANADLIKVDVAENEQLCLQFGVLSFPTIMIFKDGRQKAGLTGYTEPKNVRSMIENVVHGRDLEPPQFDMSEVEYEAMVADMKEQGADLNDIPPPPSTFSSKGDS